MYSVSWSHIAIMEDNKIGSTDESYTQKIMRVFKLSLN